MTFLHLLHITKQFAHYWRLVQQGSGSHIKWMLKQHFSISHWRRIYIYGGTRGNQWFWLFKSYSRKWSLKLFFHWELFVFMSIECLLDTEPGQDLVVYPDPNTHKCVHLGLGTRHGKTQNLNLNLSRYQSNTFQMVASLITEKQLPYRSKLSFSLLWCAMMCIKGLRSYYHRPTNICVKTIDSPTHLHAKHWNLQFNIFIDSLFPIMIMILNKIKHSLQEHWWLMELPHCFSLICH